MLEHRESLHLNAVRSEAGTTSSRKAGRGVRLLGSYLVFGLALAANAQSRYSITDEDAMGAGSPKVVVLHDAVAGAEAAIAPSEGAEISSFKVTREGKMIELLSNARNYASPPGVFHGRGPVLWPAVGMQYPLTTTPTVNCGMGSYIIAGKSYPMPCHGFAKDMPWKEIARSADSHGAQVTVQLKDSPETRKFYPFAFHLDATFTLADGRLTASYVVKSDAENSEPMPFSIGNHIGFRIPFVEGSDPLKVKFETQNTVQLLRNTVGVLNGESKPSSFMSPQALGSFSARSAMSLAGYKSQPFSRLIDPSGMTIRLTQTTSSPPLSEPLIRTNAYGDPKRGFFCPEPWFGVQNSLNTGVGAIKLKPGEKWTWRFVVEVEPPPPPDPVAGSDIKRAGSGFAFVEGPTWITKGGGYLLFSDIYNSKIIKISSPGTSEVYRAYTNASNGNAVDSQGRLYTCERDGHRVVRQEKDGSITVVAGEYEGKKLNSPNDVAVRKDGNVYFSDPAAGALLEHQDLDFNGVYRVSPQGKITLIAKMARPNGVALTPDGKTLYVADTAEKKIVAFHLDQDGNASGAHDVISNIEGSPDGLRVAANGNLYIACKGIAIYSPIGKRIKMIEFPETPVNCTFGGPDLRTLYVTARTSIYTLRVPDKGWANY